MNNYNIKNLRQAMLSTAVAALVSIGFMACSDETFMTQNSTAPTDGYQICIPASFGGGDTRAITYNSETGGYDATFETTDNIFVYDVTKGAGSAKKDQGGYWYDTYLHPEDNGKKANIIGELTFALWDQQMWSYKEEITPEVGDELMLFYNSGRNELYYNRDYTGKFYPNYTGDYAIAKVKITSIINGAITTEPSSFQNPQSIYKINFTGIGSNVKIKKMTIQSEKNKLVGNYYPTREEYPQDFGNVNYIYEGEGIDQHELIFMLRFADNPDYYPNTESTTGDVISFLALGSDGHYYRGTKSVTTDLENGKYYNADMAMTDMGVALTLTNDATGEPVEIYEWTSIQSNEAAYTLKGTGFNTSFGWYGGNNPLTLNGVTINNSGRNFLYAQTDSENPDNTKEHYLVLDGENTVNYSDNGPTAISVQENCSLYISAASTGGKLTINSLGANIWISENAKVMLESGEITLDGYLDIKEGGSFVVTKSGKLRVKQDYVEPRVKGGSGYVLQTTKEGDYMVYTVTAAPPYEQPKALSTATTADIGKIIGSDGNIHVLNWDLPEGVTPVGMIASISSTGHGLAVSLERVKIRHDEEWGGWYYSDSFSWDNSGYDNNDKTALEILEDWKANNTASFGTWHFATMAEWQNMALSCRIDGDATEPGREMIANGFTAKLKQTGIFGNYLSAWIGDSGTEEGLLSFQFNTGYWDSDAGKWVEGRNTICFYTNNDSANQYTILPVLEF